MRMGRRYPAKRTHSRGRRPRLARGSHGLDIQARTQPGPQKETGALATNVVPMTDHIVLTPVEQEEFSASGLVIPDSAKEKPQHGHVIAVVDRMSQHRRAMLDSARVGQRHKRVPVVGVSRVPHLRMVGCVD